MAAGPSPMGRQPPCSPPTASGTSTGSTHGSCMGQRSAPDRGRPGGDAARADARADMPYLTRFDRDGGYRSRMASHDVAIVPATPDRWADLADLFRASGDSAHCWCAWFRMRNQAFGSARVAGRREQLEELVE